MSNKKSKLIYGVLTFLVLAPNFMSGVQELFTAGPDQVIQSLHALGYPLYLMKILGLAKILGTTAIVYGRFPRLKEWAYAGFAFEFLGATASHILAGDPGHAPFAFVFFLLLMGSYTYWKKVQTGAESCVKLATRAA